MGASFLGEHINRSNPNLNIKERFGQAILAWKNLSEPNKQKYRSKAEADNKDLPQKIGSWETANPDAVTELKDLSKELANLRARLNPKPKKNVVKKRSFFNHFLFGLGIQSCPQVCKFLAQILEL